MLLEKNPKIRIQKCHLVGNIFPNLCRFSAGFRGILGLHKFSRPVHSTTLPPLLNRRFLPFFNNTKYFVRSKKCEIVRNRPKKRYLLLPFFWIISIINVSYENIKNTKLSTTHNYSSETLDTIKVDIKCGFGILDLFHPTRCRWNPKV